MSQVRARPDVTATADESATNRASRRCLPELFEAQVDRTPARTALVHHGNSYSYAQLNARANRLAHAMLARGIGPERIVALALPRSPGLVIALLAVLKAGGAYLPVNPGYPPARLQFLLDDAAPALLLTTHVGSAVSGHNSTPQLVLDDSPTAATIADFPDTDPTDADRSDRLTPERMAYVIYTSGSTGQPKGVVVCHRSVVNLFDHHRAGLFARAVRQAGGRPVLRAAQTASFSFDASWDQLLWMFAGHELHIIDDATRAEPDHFVAYGARHHLDYVGTTPSYLQSLVSAGLLTGHWRPGTIAIGGEAASQQLWSQLRSAERITAVNFYGTTECTVDSLSANLADSARPSMGRPIRHTQVYVLDDELELVPEGAVGELYVAGAGLARGYLHNPDLTSQRFLPCPFGRPGERMYRTGDLVRCNAEGNLEFVGRSDQQISLRGFRIEPAEIEAVLDAAPGVARSAVIARADRAGRPEDQRLVAYLVPAAEGAPPVEELRRFARQRLPEHLVPSAFVVVAAFPMTANGKLDHAALPSPRATRTPSRAPRTPTERLLCPLFADVLGVESVGTEESFFELGGHSLLVVTLANQIRAVLDTSVSIRSIFTAPTVAELSRLIDAGIDLDPFETLLPLRATGSRPPLFCLPPAGGIGWCYTGLVPHLGADQPVYALQARGLGQPGAELPDFDTMTSDYVAHIRAVQPRGPYYLLGWSLGGSFAHTVAVALREGGEPVALLAILDGRPLYPRQRVEHVDRELVSTLMINVLGEPRSAAERAGQTVHGLLGDLDENQLNNVLDIVEHDFTVRPSCPPGTFDGDLLFFHPKTDPWAGPDPVDVWHDLISGTTTVHEIDGSHAEMSQPAPMTQIGRVLAERLAAGEPE